MAIYCPGRFNRTNLTGVGMDRDLVAEKLDGKSCKGMRLDTGADRTIVRQDKIHSRSMTAKTASFKPSKSPVYSLPLAWVEVELPGFSKRMLVAVQEDLDFDALLGCDIPQVADRRAWPGNNKAVMSEVFVGEVSTRSKRAAAKRKLETHQKQEQERQQEMEEMVVMKDAARRQQNSGESEHEEGKVEVESEYSEESEEVESESGEERDKEYESERAGEEGNSEWLKELSHGVYDESEMQRKKEKEHKSREQKRRASQKFAVAEARPDPLDCGADYLRRLRQKTQH